MSTTFCLVCKSLQEHFHGSKTRLLPLPTYPRGIFGGVGSLEPDVARRLLAGEAI